VPSVPRAAGEAGVGSDEEGAASTGLISGAIAATCSPGLDADAGSATVAIAVVADRFFPLPFFPLAGFGVGARGAGAAFFFGSFIFTTLGLGFPGRRLRLGL
jgi:hypothetical protein